MVLLMTATGAAPGVVSSSARNRRPAAVAMRSVLKYGGETISPSTCSGRPARSGWSGCWVLGAACWVLVSGVGCGVLSAGCCVLGAGAECWVLVPGACGIWIVMLVSVTDAIDSN